MAKIFPYSYHFTINNLFPYKRNENLSVTDVNPHENDYMEMIIYNYYCSLWLGLFFTFSCTSVGQKRAEVSF